MPPVNVVMPTEALRPVIVLETQIPGFGLRASFDQRRVLYLALIHIDSDTAARAALGWPSLLPSNPTLVSSHSSSFG